MQKVFDFITPMYYIRSMKGNTEKDMTKFVNKITEEVELDEKVKEYKGIAYFKDRKDAEEHMKKFASKGRVVEYERGYAVQTRTSGPYLNKSGKNEYVVIMNVEEQVL
jgi:phage I-like protein